MPRSVQPAPRKAQTTAAIAMMSRYAVAWLFSSVALTARTASTSASAAPRTRQSRGPSVRQPVVPPSFRRPLASEGLECQLTD